MLTLGLVAIHVGVSLGLVLFILLHSGRGGGLSDMFGGSVGTAAAGSTVVKAVPAGKLTVARAKQVTVENWQRPTKTKK